MESPNTSGPGAYNPVPMSGRNMEVTIWASQMRPGGLPAVCVMTGEPTDRWTQVRFQTAPRWTYWVLVAGVLVVGFIPYFVIRMLVSVRAAGQLPFTQTMVSRRKITSIGGLVGLLGGIILFVVGAGTNSGAVAILGGLLFVLGLVLLVVLGTMSPRAVVRKQPGFPNDRVVVLRRVHPDFASAVVAQQQAAIQHAPSQSPAGTTPTTR
jgi:hypothetical protein